MVRRQRPVTLPYRVIRILGSLKVNVELKIIQWRDSNHGFIPDFRYRPRLEGK